VARGIERGEIRLYQFQSPDKRRLVLVLTRDSAIRFLSTVTVAPITSTIRGVRSEVLLDEGDGMKAPCVVNLHGTVSVPQRLLGRRVAQLSQRRIREVCAAVQFSFGCDLP
jgi:mRNA interferase MazF